MELKRDCDSVQHVVDFLLIVPYGIETDRNNIYVFSLFLLIVPYGIETA